MIKTLIVVWTGKTIVGLIFLGILVFIGLGLFIYDWLRRKL